MLPWLVGRTGTPAQFLFVTGNDGVRTNWTTTFILSIMDSGPYRATG